MGRGQWDCSSEVATITVTGPSKVWFGVGFNASAMKDAPWAFLVTEKLLYARAKNLKGIYIMPDQAYEFENIEFTK